MRRVSGYNLDEPLTASDGNPFNMARMVVGSEGTFCVVTEAKVNLVPVPPKKGMAVLHFHDMVRSCEATWEILKHKPDTIELIGRMILDRCRDSLGFSRLLAPIEGEPDALLVVEFSGENEAEVVDKIEKLKNDMVRRDLAYACVQLTEARDQANIWALRAAGLGLLMSTRGDSKPLPYVEDTAVDPEHLGEFIARFDQVVKAHDTQAGYYGHASVGCMHIRPLVNLKTPEGIRRMVSIASDISDLVLEYGGSLSGEHGDGIVRGVWTEKMFGPTIYKAFQELKLAFDPAGIMNPGEDHRHSSHDRESKVRGRILSGPLGDYPGLLRGRRLCGGRGNVQRHGGVPQDDRQHVPLLHGHQGRGALHQGAGKPPEGCAVGDPAGRHHGQQAPP